MCHMPMLHRVDVDVINVPLEVTFVPDLMFPEAALPDGRFAPPSHDRRRWRRVRSITAGIRHVVLYLSPTLRKRGVALGQGLDAVKVVGELDPGIDREGAALANHLDRVTRCIQHVGFAQDGTAAPCDEGEEEGGANAGAAESGHREIVMWRASARLPGETAG